MLALVAALRVDMGCQQVENGQTSTPMWPERNSKVLYRSEKGKCLCTFFPPPKTLCTSNKQISDIQVIGAHSLYALCLEKPDNQSVVCVGVLQVSYVPFRNTYTPCVQYLRTFSKDEYSTLTNN